MVETAILDQRSTLIQAAKAEIEDFRWLLDSDVRSFLITRSRSLVNKPSAGSMAARLRLTPFKEARQFIRQGLVGKKDACTLSRRTNVACWKSRLRVPTPNKMVTGGLYLMSPATHTIGPWTLATPFVWLGHDLQHPFPVWKALGKRLPPGVLLSASQIMERAWFRQDAYARGVHAALEHQGPVFLDSGGYHVQRTGRASMSTLELLAIQDRLRPDIGSVLDVPLNPVGGPGTNTRRWRQTLANTTSMVERRRGPILAPVLHAYSPTLARRRCNEIRSILPNPLIICVGSLVPLLRGSGIADRFAAQRDESRFHSRCGRLPA